MNELQIFKNPEFGEVRTVAIDGEPWFVGKDIAKALGYGIGKSLANAVANHVDSEDKGVTEMMTPGGVQQMTIINESGLYSLVLSSKLPSAKAFKRWITNEVLPTVRKTGGYVSDERAFINTYLPNVDENTKTLFTSTLSALRQANEKIAADKPKVLFADAVSTSHSSILVGELAKIIKQNGVDIGQNRLFKWLRDNGWLIRRQGTDYNMPTQKSMNMGLFEIKENSIVHADGHTSVTKTPKVTGRGQSYFINVFLGGEPNAQNKGLY